MYERNGILYADKHNEMICVTEVKVLEEYKLLLTFSNEEKKVYDVAPLLELSVFQPLKNKALFDTATLDFETVTWNNGDIDIAPETLYEQSKPAIMQSSHS